MGSAVSAAVLVGFNSEPNKKLRFTPSLASRGTGIRMFGGLPKACAFGTGQGHGIGQAQKRSSTLGGDGRGSFLGEKMVGGGGFFSAARGFLWYGSGVSWIKYRGGL